MNYVPANPNRPCCGSCGDECATETMLMYRYELVCRRCHAEHEAASAAEDGPDPDDTIPGVSMKAWDAFEARNRARDPQDQRD